ncbi:unnamed protein product [Linum trigynum]|uniref:Uncharacterized protein n=1 Tax=Linum trigynum TaxID=586398 RepID=A0AAV2DCA7_9ROSI
MWKQHETYYDLLATVWNSHGQGPIIQQVLNILKKLKLALKSLNREEFSDISGRIKQSEQDMKEKQINALRDPFEESFEAMKQSATIYQRYKCAEESFYW